MDELGEELKGALPSDFMTRDYHAWMFNLREAISQKPLNQLAIPGTHDSATYGIKITKHCVISPDFPVKSLQKAASLIGPTICKVSRCQDLDIYQQLKCGIRYFDLRVAPKGDPITKQLHLWIVHGVFSIQVEDILPQFQRFMEENKTEVIILDFQHFYGMSTTLHEVLVKQIFKFLGPWLCPDDEPCVGTTPLHRLWTADHRVLVFHGTDWHGQGANDVIRDHPIVWSRKRLVSPWYNCLDTNELFACLTTRLATKPKKDLFVSQCVLTPRASTVLSGTSIESLATKINPHVPTWINSWTSLGLRPNILIVDYFHTHPEIVDLLIEMNGPPGTVNV